MLAISVIAIVQVAAGCSSVDEAPTRSGPSIATASPSASMSSSPPRSSTGPLTVPIDDVCTPFTADLAGTLLPGSIQRGDSSFNEEVGGAYCNYTLPDEDDSSYATLVFGITDTNNPNVPSLGGRPGEEALVAAYGGTLIDLPDFIPGAYCYEFVQNGEPTVSFVWMRGDFGIGLSYLRTPDRTPALDCGDLAPVAVLINGNL